MRLVPSIQGIRLQELAARKLLKIGDHLEGTLDFQGELSGTKTKAGDSHKSIRARGKLRILKGTWKDFNLLEGVLSRVTGLPGIGNLVATRLPSRYASLFQRKDTPFDRLEGSFRLADGKLESHDLVLISGDYGVEAAGWIDLEQRMEWQATLFLSRKFTAELVRKHKNLRYAADARGRLVVPFVLKGKIPKLRPIPDLRKLVESLQRNFLRRGMERLFRGQKQREPLFPWLPKGLQQLFR
jgi:hypothetical protein